MAKPLRSNRRKSNGKRSPSTQDIRSIPLRNMPGRTDGTFSIDAIPTHRPSLAKRNPRVSSGIHSKLTRSDIESLPADALVAIDGARQPVIALYDVEFESVADVVSAMLKRLEP